MNKVISLLVITFLTSLINVGSTAAEPKGETALPEGDYVVVALRRASYVEGAAVTDGSITWIGETVSFGGSLTWLNGIFCEDWRAEPIADAGIFLDEPYLSDLTIKPLEPPEGWRPQARSLRLYCNGGHLSDILQIDSRVIVVHSPTRVMNAILERPLNAEKIGRLQASLKDMKYYSGEVTGEMDEVTRNAVSHYADYRGAEYVFHSAALTENLLDKLNVLEK